MFKHDSVSTFVHDPARKIHRFVSLTDFAKAEVIIFTYFNVCPVITRRVIAGYILTMDRIGSDRIGRCPVRPVVQFRKNVGFDYVFSLPLA
jgi:hypothetical protein